MPFDPALPADHADLSSAEMRSQLTALKSLMDALSAQLAPVVPQLTRDADGNWTLAYTGPPVAGWQFWVSNADIPPWALVGHLGTDTFPATDEVMSPGGVWWQVKICGENGDGQAVTPFSNTIAQGDVPA